MKNLAFMPQNAKLGRIRPSHAVRCKLPQFSDYITQSQLPKVPSSFDWSLKVPSWPMMLNDNLGDCTIAAAGHMIELWTEDSAGTPAVIPDSEILKAYSAVSGYVPGRPNTDNGAVETDVLNYWKTTGIGGHKISGYAALEPNNRQQLLEAAYLFGGVYIGIELPISCQGKSTWYVPSTGPNGNGAPGSWGGHAVPIVGVGNYGVKVITWGQVLTASWNFLKYYCEEMYAVLSTDWFASPGKAPSGFDYTALQADLALL